VPWPRSSSSIQEASRRLRSSLDCNREPATCTPREERDAFPARKFHLGGESEVLPAVTTPTVSSHEAGVGSSTSAVTAPTARRGASSQPGRLLFSTSLSVAASAASCGRRRTCTRRIFAEASKAQRTWGSSGCQRPSSAGETELSVRRKRRSFFESTVAWSPQPFSSFQRASGLPSTTGLPHAWKGCRRPNNHPRKNQPRFPRRGSSVSAVEKEKVAAAALPSHPSALATSVKEFRVYSSRHRDDRRVWRYRACCCCFSTAGSPGNYNPLPLQIRQQGSTVYACATKRCSRRLLVVV